MSVPTDRLYLGKRYHAGLFLVFGFVSFLFSVWFIRRGAILATSHHRALSALIVSLWSVGPPVWFFIEYFYYFPKYGNPKAGFQGLKSAQEVTSKVWAAIAILLGVLFVIKFGR